MYQVMSQNPDSTVLTISKHSRIIVNQAVITRLFLKESPLAYVQRDYEMDVIPMNLQTYEGNYYTKLRQTKWRCQWTRRNNTLYIEQNYIS
jgi:hypothetical protein